jgi:drug/metabolite transporter (DMT)-like permease
MTFFHPFAGLIMALCIVVARGGFYESKPQWVNWVLFGSCVIDYVGINALIVAFQKDSSGFVAIIGYLSVVYSYGIDRIAFESEISPIDFAGATLILIVTIGVVYYKVRHKQK